MFKKFLSVLKESVKDHTGKISSSRLSSYFVLLAILLQSLIFTIIEIKNIYISIQNETVYTVPANHIIIFGMVLAHHLTLLGITKTSKDILPKDIKPQNTNEKTEV